MLYPFLPVLSSELVLTDTGVAGSHDASAPSVGVHIFLRQVGIGGGIVHDDQRIALIDELDRLLVARDDGDNIVRESELSGASLVELRRYENRGAVELSVIIFFDI